MLLITVLETVSKTCSFCRKIVDLNTRSKQEILRYLNFKGASLRSKENTLHVHWDLKEVLFYFRCILISIDERDAKACGNVFTLSAYT